MKIEQSNNQSDNFSRLIFRTDLAKEHIRMGGVGVDARFKKNPKTYLTAFLNPAKIRRDLISKKEPNVNLTTYKLQSFVTIGLNLLISAEAGANFGYLTSIIKQGDIKTASTIGFIAFILSYLLINSFIMNPIDHTFNDSNQRDIY